MPRSGMPIFGPSTSGDTRERLRPAARLSEEEETSPIRAELRADPGDHRHGAAARGAPRVVVGKPAQPAGKDAAARGLPRRRIYRDTAGGWKDGTVQEDEVRAVAAQTATVVPANACECRDPEIAGRAFTKPF